MEWINTKEQLPNKGEYVLVETKYCEYPAAVCIFNGLDFKCAIDGYKIGNVEYWKEIKLRK